MNPRAIEAGARAEAIRRWGADGAWADCVPAVIAVITAYEAHLKAEGFVVVPVEPTTEMQDAGLRAALHEFFDCPGETKIEAVRRRLCSISYRAMIAAAQEPNDA